MRKVTVAITLMGLLCLATSALAVNETTSLVMTHVVTAYGPCDIPDPCPNPAVNANIGDGIAAYLCVRNFDTVAGVQTAFEWGNWVFMFGLWDCQVSQVNGTTPMAPGGPTAGTIATAFNAITGPGTAVIGRMHMTITGPGCVNQVMSSFPFGNHVVDNTGGVTEIIPDCWGSVCAPDGGIDACAECGGSTAVEPATWGSIKSQYN